MDLGSSDDGTEIALEGSAFPQALLDAAELPEHDDLDGLDLRLAETCGSSDTENCSYRTSSDVGDVGMQLSSSSQGGAATVTEMAWISTVAVTERRKLQ